ncbi:type II toxin-antitoxin system Phd/YefM family antitoxin [Labrys wisconsinensis]|uniref:Antitoxin n=1 Tax=Labrys wisconsinensis TaxID=425677 RepID=A0ABU0JIM9_9HYPH|nr:type II toxin-antitoxin system Phd/YefM family antitoxin [Labrys wisconsinensis]MDQ0474145.1 prevent-host-death family protein [Labrys wisconsinensis]
MKELPLREAKRTLSAVVDASEHGEPTMIIGHGRPAAVILSHDEWSRLRSKIPSFVDPLLAMPALAPEDLPGRRPARIGHAGFVD